MNALDPKEQGTQAAPQETSHVEENPTTQVADASAGDQAQEKTEG